MAKATVTAVISPFEDDRRTVLLTKRTVEPFRGRWCFPGGHIDRGETARQAIVREVAEETGLTLHGPEFIGYCDEIFPEYGFFAEVLIFRGTGTGPMQAGPEEVSEIGWFTLEEARELPLAFNHLDVLERYESRLDPI